MKNKRFTLYALLILSLFLCSCKAYRNVENLNPKVSEERGAGDFDVNSLNKLVEGDRIILTTTDGKKHNLFFKRINGDQMLGTTINRGLNKSEITENFALAITDIEKVLVLRVSAAATAPVVALGAIVVFFGIIAILLTSVDLDGKQKSHSFKWLFAIFIFRKSISDFREIKGFQKLRSEVSGFKLFILK